MDLENVVTNFAVGFDVSDVCENCCAFAENVVLDFLRLIWMFSVVP